MEPGVRFMKLSGVILNFLLHLLPPPKKKAGKLSADDLNSLIAHAHRRIDQLNRELAEQRVREQIRIETALDQQKHEHQKSVEQAVATALEHHREGLRLEQEKKVRG